MNAEYLDLQRSLKKAATADEKSVVKLEKEGIQLKFGYALIDGNDNNNNNTTNLTYLLMLITYLVMTPTLFL